MFLVFREVRIADARDVDALRSALRELRAQRLGDPRAIRGIGKTFLEVRVAAFERPVGSKGGKGGGRRRVRIDVRRYVESLGARGVDALDHVRHAAPVRRAADFEMPDVD